MQRKDSLEKYFWDHTQDASAIFKLIRLLEYASFPDIIKIPFKDIKDNLREIDIKRLRASNIRKLFISKLQSVAPNCITWDEAIYAIIGIKRETKR